jgi:hypothetical protein
MNILMRRLFAGGAHPKPAFARFAAVHAMGCVARVLPATKIFIRV